MKTNLIQKASRHKRSCKMKLNPNMLRTLGMGALLLFATSCEKDNNEPNRNNPDTPQPQPKTYTYVYDINGIPKDTVLAHTDVDTFYVIPTTYDLFATWGTENIHDLREHLENCQNQNPKTHGKDRLRAKNASVADSTWLANFGYQMER